jgi:thioredoxin reductase
MKMHDAAIIGAGPAGIAAAVQLQRYSLDFLLLERGEVGGLLRNANWVENYPGFPRGISGLSLVQRMREHIQAAGIETVQAEVTSLAYQEGAFHLSTSVGELRARVLVIASGTKPKLFTDLDFPAALCSRVFYEVYPLADATQRRIAIVGAGDVAFDYALNLAWRNQIIILNRGERPSCLPLLWEYASQSPSIAYFASTHLLRLVELPSGELLLECAGPDGGVQFKADLLIGALGREPQHDFIPAEFRSIAGELESRGLLYWIGDVKNGIERQTAIAVGDGVQAAMKIYRRLKDTSL